MDFHTVHPTTVRLYAYVLAAFAAAAVLGGAWFAYGTAHAPEKD